MSLDLTKELIIERYKFIQDKQKHLDNALSSNVNLLVKLLISVFTLVFATFGMHLKQPEIVSIQVTSLVFTLSLILSLLVSTIFLLMTISNIFAWFGYRKDEVELLKQFGGVFQREKPKLSNLLSWQETWFICALTSIIIIAIVTWYHAPQLIDLLLKSF
ncbi:hypothetical protein [Photobacterium kishitanii]|nr:hypothetical protein [Photobacterium kishitanii]